MTKAPHATCFRLNSWRISVMLCFRMYEGGGVENTASHKTLVTAKHGKIYCRNLDTF